MSADVTSLAMTTALIVAGSTEASLIKRKKAPTMKPVIGAFILGTFLMVIGMASPDITVKFCWLIIVSALLVNGASLFAFA